MKHVELQLTLQFGGSPTLPERRVPRSRLRWRTLSDWLAAYRTLDERAERRVSASLFYRRECHVCALLDALEVIEACTEPELLREIVLIVKGGDPRGRAGYLHFNGYRPPRGARAGHWTTRLLDALDRRVTRIQRDRERASRSTIPSRAIA